MTDDEKKKDPAEELRKKLGGAAAKPQAPLPGPVVKPGGLPLPGIGSKSPGAPLPGLGAKPAVVPPFMQQPEQKGPTPEELARDPFGKGKARPRRSYPPTQEVEEARLTLDPIAIARAKQYRRKSVGQGAIVAVVGIVLGCIAALAQTGRTDRNIALRDARIADWEIRNAAKIFDEAQAVVASAVGKAEKQQYDAAHLEFFTEKVKASPLSATTFPTLQYKQLDPALLESLMNYYQKWTKLNQLIQDHRRKSESDRPILTAAGETFEKLLTPHYGAVLTTEADEFVANLVVLGLPSEEKGKKTMITAQQMPGLSSADFEILSAAPGAKPASMEADTYVIEMAPETENGLLKDAIVPHFGQYTARLKAIAAQMRDMTDEQKRLLDGLGRLSSEKPSIGGKIDVEKDVAAYIQSRGPQAEKPAE